jgi:predicted dehydrogenase
MRTLPLMLTAVAVLSFAAVRPRAGAPDAPPDIRLMTLDPGHFHAALVQKEMYPGVSPHVDVFAPLGPDLLEHLGRIASYNLRAERPTAWQLEVHTSPDFFERMLRDRPGNVVVISGRNQGKIARILGSVQAGLNVLADKPWVLQPSDMPSLERALDEAETRRVVAYDIMTERFEVTTALQRALVNDAQVFGDRITGTADAPAVYMESVHHLMKEVSGVPLTRPAWFFDTAQQGEGLNDVGTHLVDLAQWTLFPDQAIDYHADVKVLDAQRWPTRITEAQFKRVTLAGFPETLRPHVVDGTLEYFCNTLVSYTLRGAYVTLNVIWDWEAPPGSGDRHFAVYRGSRSRVEVQQSQADGYRPELYVFPTRPADASAVREAVRARVAALQAAFPGAAVDERRGAIHVSIPDALRVGHEAHFAQVTANFLRYVRDRRTLPAWERPNMLAKYYVTTAGTALSHERPVREAPRLAP